MQKPAARQPEHMILNSTHALLDTCQTVVKLAGHIAVNAYIEKIIHVIDNK